MDKNFIPFENALELEGLGFDEKCISVYLTSTKQPYPKYRPYTKKEQTDEILRPLYQQAFAWLLKKHGLFAETTLWGDGIGYISRIKQIKQEEFLTVYDLGLVTPRRGLPNWDRKKEEVLSFLKMISIVKTLVDADRLFQGKVCTHCSAEFKEEHGYPVLCTSCYFESSKEDRAIYEKATKKEI